MGYNALGLFSAQELTLDHLQRLLNGPRHSRNVGLKVIPIIRCGDGLELSIQASNFHRCTPQDMDGPYSHVEFGPPPEVIDELLPYIDSDDEYPPTKRCYNYVPVEVALEIVNAHGGIML